MANRMILNETSYFGAGAISEIVNEVKKRAFKKALVVTDPDLIKFNVAQNVTSLLENAGQAYEIFSEVKANPTVAVVKAGVSAFKKADADNDTASNSVIQSEASSIDSTSNEPSPGNANNSSNHSKAPSSATVSSNSNLSNADNKIDAPVDEQFDLFSYCKNFAIEKGTLNGDYCIYQQPATKYGGYDNEYFSISYWGDSNMVEFCLHCPLSETYSHNFYLRMRGGYNKKYEYLSSKYFRDTGESLRSATGSIDPAVFSDSYPISCDKYEGSFDGQNEFMEESRVGICDLIRCLKEFVAAEGMACDFSDFEFVNF